MVFRFLSVLVLLVSIGLAGNFWERRCLDLRRTISSQHYRIDVLKEREVRTRLFAESLSTPERLSDREKSKLSESESSHRVRKTQKIGRTPLLRWNPRHIQERP